MPHHRPICPHCDAGVIETCLTHGGANCPCSTVSRGCEKCDGTGYAACVECGDWADVEHPDSDGKRRTYCAECAAAVLMQDFKESA